MTVQKVGVVTGAAKGLGFAIASRLVQDGWLVVMLDLLSEVGEAAKQIGATSMVCDVSSSSAVQRVAKDIHESIGTVSLLVNNAGINRDSRLIQMTDEQWDEVIGVNLTSTFYCTRSFAPGMLEEGWGRIVNLSSVGVRGSRNISNYAASKAAIIGFTRSAALEFASRNVTVNAIAPGAINTDMFRLLPKQVTDRFLEQIPAKRVGEPSDVAALVAFLVSEHAAYITGQTIFIDGGLSLGYL